MTLKRTVTEYLKMFDTPGINAIQLKAFRVKHGLFRVGDAVVYPRRNVIPIVLYVQSTTPKTMQPKLLRSGRLGNLRVSGTLRHATAEEIARCSHLN